VPAIADNGFGAHEVQPKAGFGRRIVVIKVKPCAPCYLPREGGGGIMGKKGRREGIIGG
jgi:hypothetical protein